MGKAVSLLSSLIPLFLAVVVVSSSQETKSSGPALKLDSTPQTLSIPADSPRWDLEGQAKAAEYQGRKCLLLDGGAAVLKEFEMRDGVVDMAVATPASYGFFGMEFRIV